MKPRLPTGTLVQLKNWLAVRPEDILWVIRDDITSTLAKEMRLSKGQRVYRCICVATGDTCEWIDTEFEVL